MFDTNTLFASFAPTSKVWVFTSSALFTDEQEKQVNSIIKPFIDTWAAHGNALDASFTIAYSRFILICVNDNAASASGCSIDKLFHSLSEIETVTGYTLLDRSLCAYMDDNKNIITLPFPDFKARITKDEIRAGTWVFNNSVDNLTALKTEWLQPLENSVFKRWVPFSKEQSATTV